jgi:hypothetical protein
MPWRRIEQRDGIVLWLTCREEIADSRPMTDRPRLGPLHYNSLRAIAALNGYLLETEK